uniref:Glucosylceramidase n=1 Tax=Aceria tosichella TaxID=561515 RepID=A0A6G1S947_9ACAR
MERFDIEQPSWRPQSANSNGPKLSVTTTNANWQVTSRFISLRKYSTAICLIEALAILFLIYLLMRLPPAPLPSDQLTGQQHGNVSNSNQPYRTYYSDGKLGLSAMILPGLVPDCNQRRHDLSYSVQCKSNQIEQCGDARTGHQIRGIASDSFGVSGGSYAADSTSQELPGQVVEIIETSKRGHRLAPRKQVLKRIKCHTTPKDQQHHDQGDHATGDDDDDDARCRFGTRIELNRAKSYQKIIGWGGALSDSSIQNILSLTVNGTRRLLDDYFGPDGLRFNMARVTIGGSDFSARFYTNDDHENADLNPREAQLLKRFELVEEDYLYKIPMLRMIQREYNYALDGDGQSEEKHQIKVFASMWSPPVWMKTNRHFNKGQLRGFISDEPLIDRNEIPITEGFYDSLSELKMKWLLSYHKEQVEFWGLTVMNEPIFAVQPFLNFNTMIFPRMDYANYVAKYLGPKLKYTNVTKHIKLIVHDDNRRFLMDYTKPILDERRVRQFVDGVSVHGYVDEEYKQMDYMYENYKDIDKPPELAVIAEKLNIREPDDWFVLPTELCSGHLPFMAKALVGNWHRGIHYALDIIRSLQHSAAGWVDWNMVLDTEGGPGWLGGRLDAPIIVDKSRDLYHKSPMFYVLGQFSRFIPAGSQRIQTTVMNDLYDHQFEVVSFKVNNNNDDETRGPNQRQSPTKLVTVIVNNNPYQIEALLQTDEPNKVAKPDEISSGKTKVYHVIECPADSVITIRYE